MPCAPRTRTHSSQGAPASLPHPRALPSPAAAGAVLSDPAGLCPSGICPEAALAHHGLAPEAAPVLQTQHAATGLVTHCALGAHGQVPLQPLVRHGDLQATKRHAPGVSSQPPRKPRGPSGKNAPK